MVHCCVVKSCKSVWIPNSNISFFSLRVNKPAVLKKWLEAIPNLHSVKYYHRICSKHFLPEYIRKENGRTYLTEDAVPTVFEKENMPIGTATSPSILRKALTGTTCLSVQSKLKMKVDRAVGNSDSEIVEYPDKTMHHVQVQTTYTAATMSARENRLRRKVKTLQARLRRKNKHIQYAKQLVTYLKNYSKSMDNLEHASFTKFNMLTAIRNFNRSRVTRVRVTYRSTH
ncbi:THAP domain-containing protein 1 isoform X1 [Orussus abietinus]|uniref:THAP domain-containing protein 1 isoform X1 n=1 Tax=Orussus abietinus TaxID=222816 RepID=UPI000625FF5A|nr:THAP domain-containing protein 1 isoform X1 [Orussus abietinus]